MTDYTTKDHYSQFNVLSWQPIETAPKDGYEILTYGQDEDGIEFYWVSGWWPFPTQEEGHWTGWHDSNWATHWMPLPRRPKEIEQ